MIQKTMRNCCVCSSKEATTLYSHQLVAPSNVELPTKQDIVICNSCFSIFTDIDGDQSVFDKYYESLSKYADESVGTGGASTKWDELRLKSTVDFFLPYLRSHQTSILDLGCANGGLLSKLKDRGYTNLCGVDPSNSCVQFLSKNHGVRSLQGSLFDNLLLEGEKFDVIILTGVLEHIYDLKTVMNNIARLSSDENGIVVVEVPDVYRYQDFSAIPYQDFNLEHINHFSPVSLENIMSLYGFSVVTVQQRDVALSETHDTPAVIGVFKKDNKINQKTIKPDTEAKELIENYIKKSNIEMQKLNNDLLKKLNEVEELMVWGTGQLCLKLLQLPALQQKKITQFIDSNKILHGAYLQKVLITAADQVDNSDKLPILVTTIYHDVVIRDFIRNNLKWDNQIISLKDLNEY